MPETLLNGVDDRLEAAPAGEWRAQVQSVRHHMESRLHFVTPDHQRVRYFAVSRLISNGGRPLEPEAIARELGLPLARVHSLLDDLERGLFFLVRDRAGRIQWAFPVTVERTPHDLSFDSGERLFAA
jgi:hypothetical protein